MPTTPSSTTYSASTSASSASSASTCRLMDKTTSRLASEYARTSEELLAYVSFLESALERARAETHRFQQEALDSRNNSALATHRLTLAHRQAHTLAADKAQALEAAHHCKEQLCLTQALLAEEQIRAKNLKSQIEDLKEAARKKDELRDERKLKERRVRKSLKKQNEVLLRKATLSWILACLSNPFLEADTSKVRTVSLLRMARDLLQPDDCSRAEAQSSLTFSDMKAKSLRLECAYVENEIKHLLDLSGSSSRSSSEDSESLKIPSRTLELSTTRSFKDEGTNTGVDKEGRCSSRREQRKGCSPIRSILKAAQDLFDDADECGCAAAQDHLESREFYAKESQPGRDIHNAAAKKKCPLTRSQVPPLDIPGNKSTSGEIPSSFYMNCGLDAYNNAYNNGHCGVDGELRMDDDDEQLPRKKKKKQQKQKRELASDATPRENQVFNKRQAEREEIAKCQSDIMKTLHGLKANMGYLLDLEERSQFKHPYTS